MTPIDVSISKHAEVKTMRLQLNALAERLADEWLAAQRNNRFGHYHFYYRPSKPGLIGQLLVAEEQAESFELADARRISPDWTREMARLFIRQQMDRIPILMQDTESFPARNGKPYTCVRVSDIETPAQGVLYNARESKKKHWKRVKQLREKIRANRLNSQGYRLDLIAAESNWREARYCEQGALDAIEQRANELGLTTRRPKKGAKAHA